ncbi:MAG: ABC transporter substrate-binding protein [Anaerolineae bacterium]|nr:ABC transporter substrate-binding protein [Anaerolineae bacterium]
MAKGQEQMVFECCRRSLFAGSAYRMLLVILLVVVAALAACKPAPGPDQVRVQLSWFHSVEFAGFYAAVQQGYYVQEDLSVELVPGGFDVIPTNEVAAGQADLGITGGESLMIARAGGASLQAVATIFRKSPVVLMSLATSNIRTPQDMIGKRVGLISPAKDNTNDIQLLAMLNQLDLDPSEIEFVVIEDYSVGSLTSGAMDVYNGFSTNEPIGARLQGTDVNLIFPQDYGVLMYANVLFATDNLISEKPQLVERFVRATLKGYQYAIEHPDEMAELAFKYDDSLDLAFQKASMYDEIPLIDTGDAPIGTMDAGVWQSTLDILLEQGFVSSPIDLNALYTNQFVEKAK